MRSFLLWAIRATLVVSSSARTCYFPDGTPTGTDVPCDGDAEDSFCCFTGQACLSNKICGAFHTNTTGTSLVYARGTCTDPTWNSPACPKFCLDGESTLRPVPLPQPSFAHAWSPGVNDSYPHIRKSHV